MNSSNSKRVPIWKLFGKLRSLIAVANEADAPHRSWDRASSREIQLEFDFERSGRKGVEMLTVSPVAMQGQRGGERDKSWRQN
jgi:hypothetical protein